jgi:hypothetical protein
MIDVLANESTQHRRQLRKYLLGKLPEDEATQLDTRLFADDTLREELEEEQESLVEDFVYGRLAADEHETFETQCAQAESLREKVGSLRALVAALDRSTVPSPAPIAWKFKRISSVLLPALALVLCCVFLYVQERHKSATFVTPTTSTVATTHPAEPHPSNMSVVAFLSANVVRGPASVPEIKLPQAGTVLELQVEVRTNPSAPSAWDIVLLRGGEMIQSSNNVPLHRLGRVSYLSLAVDVASLHAGSYSVRYSPVTEPRATRERSFEIR